MIPSFSIGPRTLLDDCNHSATAIFWRSAITIRISLISTLLQRGSEAPYLSKAMAAP